MGNQEHKKPDEIHELMFVPSAVRRIAESLIGTCVSPVSCRLRSAARETDRATGKVSKLQQVSAELLAAAKAIDAGAPPPKLSRLVELLKVPVSKDFLKALPDEYREEWHLLNNQLARAEAHLEMFTAASWAQVQGPSSSRIMALRLRGDELLGEDVSLLAANAGRMAEASLMQAGFALLSVARYLDRMVSAIIPFLFICDSSDVCQLGTVDDCEAADIYFPPYQDGPSDADDFDTALKLLKGAGWLLPAKYLTPGGKKMIREIADMLKRIKARVDKEKIDLDGYGVYVVLNYEECVDGKCGNYWESKSKVVRVDPPPGKKHPIGDGWKASVIEDLGKNEAATQAQLDEFKRLAESQCP